MQHSGGEFLNIGSGEKYFKKPHLNIGPNGVPRGKYVYIILQKPLMLKINFISYLFICLPLLTGVYVKM
jgi:hypothetical protein